MPTGVCELCLKTKLLPHRHLVPPAMHTYLRDPTKKNPNPVLVG
jgi:hypothetical protein